MKSASEKAEAGYVDSQLMLADFYQYGTYGPVNPDKAKHWYEIAAGNGNRSAKAALCREYKIMCEEKENAG